jgi:hypothetical protein
MEDIGENPEKLLTLSIISSPPFDYNLQNLLANVKPLWKYGPKKMGLE